MKIGRADDFSGQPIDIRDLFISLERGYSGYADQELLIIAGKLQPRFHRQRLLLKC